SNQQIRIVRSLDITITYPKQSSVPSNLIPIKAKTNEIGNYTFLNRKFAYKWQFRPKRTLSKPTSFPLGQWFKITVIDDGIYDISLQDLKDAGFSEQRINTNRIFLYSNSTGGREIDDTPGIDVLDNLVENSRFIDGGMDGYLDNDDNIRFYGRASSGMDANSSGILNYHRNSYSNYNYYWVLISDSPGSPKPMQTVASSASPNIAVAKYERVQRHEVESVNYLRSGKEWYGEKFHGSGSNVSVIFQIPEPGDDDPPGYKYPVDLEVKTRGVTNEVLHYFKLYLNNSPNYLSNWSTGSFYIATKKLNISMNPGSINILKLNYTSSVSAGQAHLDYAQITYQCPLKPRGASMDFWGPASSGVVEYSLSDISLSSPVVYDITNWSDVKIQTTPDVPTNNEITLRAYNNITDRSHFLITNTEHHKSPEKIEKIDDPQWNVIRRPDISAQYVIITVEEFQDAANDLAKLYSQDIREEDRLSTIVVYQSQILREFNADIVDPHAIRQFLTYTFRNWTPPLPEYVLLLGDGTFDYRHIESEKGDIVMTYQVEPSSQSGNGFVSYSADTRFVYIYGSDNKMDLAIGRINARTADEAQAVIDKIRNYILEPIYGEWRSTVTLVADDPERPHSNEKYHISDSESYIFKHLPGSIDVKKVYLLEYPEVQDASTYGVKKPDATVDLLKQIEKGTTIINYLGHGSPTVWTQEHILDMNRDMGNIKSGMKLPFWIAATCSWGQFDDITGICMPEALVVEPNNGAIAALAPTRATYPGSNRAFINSWIMKWFNPVGANRISLGKLLQAVSCSGSGINENNEKYMLFGDPALYLALPYEKVKFNRLDTDTLKTLSNIQVHGMIDENDGASFNGEGIIKLFDSERLVTRHYTDSNGKPQSLSYLILGDVLFNGLTNISNGKFSSKFFIPKDLNYANRNGKIT
ncbi:MAG: type IX secretion system sortase PorU, partial [Candidatus Marinimicrobia bacterium]|nr:type IX secretion system sortase PorU [Candidatus Neomarinimicrobiota bacterium]